MFATPVPSQDGPRRLRCLIVIEPVVFTIEDSCRIEIGDLKEIIQRKRATGVLKNIDALNLDLWKPHDSNPIPSRPAETVAKHIGSLGDSISKVADSLSKVADKLDPTDPLFSIFPSQQPLDHLHIIVTIRPPATITPSVSNESKASSTPSTSNHWSPRRDTVRRLYEISLEEKIVQVRGTPGCGKTTLMELLHSHILEQSPSTLVYTRLTWPARKEDDQSDEALTERLKIVDPLYPRRHGLAFLLFDDAQDTYEDQILWNIFFKGVGDGRYHCYRVILFCSYGSPSARPVLHHIGTPLLLRDAARISLWPREGSIGILLKRSEFDEVVSRFEHPINLHPELLDLIFDWTVGHAGAVIEMLRVISYQKASESRHGLQFTVEAFFAENPTHNLVQALYGGAFGRGLPLDTELKDQPDVVALFRNLLKHGMVDRNENEDIAIRKCHRHGWIHADQTANKAITRYAFPSPLHTVCLSWRLEPTNNMPHLTSLFDLALDAISKFKPSQLYLPIRRVNPRPTDKVPEAQYQDEFYRSIFSATVGNVRLSPEFASARKACVAGRIDFFIPVVKWGIEFTRDGKRLDEHSSRFAQSGAYGAWLKSGDMADYILLDCRTTIPRKSFPNIQNLFHVVFHDDFQKFVVYNNMAKLVKGPIALLENH